MKPLSHNYTLESVVKVASTEILTDSQVQMLVNLYESMAPQHQRQFWTLGVEGGHLAKVMFLFQHGGGQGGGR